MMYVSSLYIISFFFNCNGFITLEGFQNNKVFFKHPYTKIQVCVQFIEQLIFHKNKVETFEHLQTLKTYLNPSLQLWIMKDMTIIFIHFHDIYGIILHGLNEQACV
jgi:hypothetical protein